MKLTDGGPEGLHIEGDAAARAAKPIKAYDAKDILMHARKKKEDEALEPFMKGIWAVIREYAAQGRNRMLINMDIQSKRFNDMVVCALEEQGYKKEVSIIQDRGGNYQLLIDLDTR